MFRVRQGSSRTHRGRRHRGVGGTASSGAGLLKLEGIRCKGSLVSFFFGKSAETPHLYTLFLQASDFAIMSDKALTVFDQFCEMASTQEAKYILQNDPCFR